MIRISLPYIFNLSLQLDPLASIDDKEAPLQEIYVTLLVADGALGPLVQGGLYSPYLRSSNPGAGAFEHAQATNSQAANR